MSLIEEFEIWARKEIVQTFPRRVGLYEWKEVRDEVELFDYVESKGRIDCYSTIFAENIKKFDTVLIDVDGHDGFADEKVSKVIRILKERRLKFRLYFTGRGYHVFVDFEPVVLNDYRHVMLSWFKSLRIDRLIDLVASGSVRRMARLPMTWNSKVGKMMERLSGKDGFNDKLSDELVSFDREKSELKRFDDDSVVLSGLDEHELPKCVLKCLDELRRTGDLSHMGRFHIATFLLKVWDYERVKDVFRMARDFNERVTDYQLRHIIEKEYKCVSCRKLKMFGFCDFDDQKRCAYYVLTNGWLEMIRKGDENEVRQ